MAIANYLVQTLYLCKACGANADGSSKYSNPIAIRCRVEHRTNLVTNSSGERVASTSRVFVSAQTDIGLDDRVSIGCRTYHVIRVDEDFGMNLSHKVAYLG